MILLPGGGELWRHIAVELLTDRSQLPGHICTLRGQDRCQVRRDVSEDLVWCVIGRGLDRRCHRGRRSVTAGGAVAKAAGGDGVGFVNTEAQCFARSRIQIGEPFREGLSDLGQVAALAFADEMLDGQLAPHVEVQAPASRAAQLAYPARTFMDRRRVTEQRLAVAVVVRLGLVTGHQNETRGRNYPRRSTGWE